MENSMLTLYIEDGEFYDEVKQQFVVVSGSEVKLEHSLFSISKWEAILEKPFLPNVFTPEKTEEEEKIYAECMIIGKVPSKTLIDMLWLQHRETVLRYISKPHTATTVQRAPASANQPVTKIITSEIIYYQMIAFGIPVEFDKWHFNRLLALIDVFVAKNSKQKISPAETAAQRAALNAKRLAAQKGK
jgi:hypothetical protein